ncbi:MAG: phosphate uptake regulator PhoU [Candidatus Bathyarchaeota archaeon]|nr:MAG: phosphate uptake regulator PhoU [Candidatus Bathyarchaeota archaeon]
MELRKVQRTNSGTFFISLPKKWAERFKLDKGETLAVSESIDGCLHLDPKYETEYEPLAAELKPTPYLSREIMGRYLLGYDIIRVEAGNRITPEERRLIKQTSSRLIGLEIVEEDYARIVLQCLLGPVASSPEKILRREYNIAAGMHRDAIRAFLESDTHLAKNVVDRDIEVNRFYFLLVRTLRTAIQNPNLGEKLGIRSIDCLDYRLCASFVEAIGDGAVEIAHKALSLKNIKTSVEVSRLTNEFHSLVLEAQEKALRAFFEHDIELAEEVRNSRADMGKRLLSMETIAKKQPSEIVPLILVVASSLYRIFGYSVDIADLVMPRKL